MRLFEVLIAHLQTKIEGEQPFNEEETSKRSVLEELR